MSRWDKVAKLQQQQALKAANLARQMGITQSAYNLQMQQLNQAGDQQRMAVQTLGNLAGQSNVWYSQPIQTDVNKFNKWLTVSNQAYGVTLVDATKPKWGMTELSLDA